MLTVTNLTKAFGARTLFDDVTLLLHAGARYGLVGANGSGKTTFLNIVAGDEPPSNGSVSIARDARVGVLRQDRFADQQQRVLDVAMMGDRAAWSTLEQLDRATHEAVPDPTHIADLEERLTRVDAYSLESRARAILVGLGIPLGAVEQPLSQLSGGFSLRVHLAQVLLGGADLLLLDEPTNHLDILSIGWLERFLESYAGCALIISHDMRFLDTVTTHTLDVDYSTITAYSGNYTRSLKQKEETRSRKEVEVARAQKAIAEKRAFVERFGAKASKARQAQSRLKQIEKIEVEALVVSSRRAPGFDIEIRRPSGRDVLEVRTLCKSYAEHHVLRDVSLDVRRGERIGIIGANGLGKSTLLKVLVGKVPFDAGHTRWGHETHLGYFAQNHADLFDDPKQTALDFLWNACPDQTTAFVRGRLGRALFSGSDVEKPLAQLSGGEAARLIFARLLVERPNVLLLDEPTNHLDLESTQALADALSTYAGTMLFVSHDRWFVSRLATRIIELRQDGVQDFRGTYDEYISASGDDHLDGEVVALKAKQARRDTATQKGASDYEERKRRTNRKKSVTATLARITGEIEQVEERAAAIEARFYAEGFFEATAPEEVAALDREKQQYHADAERLMAEWERLEEELATLDTEG